MSHSSSTGPQPLAVRDLYTGRHKRAQFHTTTKPEPSNADYFSYIASHFTINDQRPPAGTFEKAERARDLYTELEADLSFLQKMRDIWEAKLAQLNMDFDMLQDMAKAQPKDVDELIDHKEQMAIGSQADKERPSLHSQSISASKTPPIIPRDITPTQLGYFDDDDQQLMSILSGDQENILLEEQEDDNTTEIPTTISDPHDTMEQEDEDMEEEEEEGEIEDDEKARQALTLMLAEYGDQL